MAHLNELEKGFSSHLRSILNEVIAQQPIVQTKKINSGFAFYDYLAHLVGNGKTAQQKLEDCLRLYERYPLTPEQKLELLNILEQVPENRRCPWIGSPELFESFDRARTQIHDAKRVSAPILDYDADPLLGSR